MKVVEFYIMRRALAVFTATLLWVLAIVWTTQVLTRINIVTTSGQSAATFFEIAMLVLPAVIPVVMPFAVGIAVAQTLTTMNTDSETVVLSAAGAPRATILRPMLIIALLACAASFLLHNFVEPHSRERMRHLVAEARADLISTVVEEGSFQRIEDGLYIQISGRLPDGRFSGIFLADRREDGAELIYYARTGAMVEAEGEQLLVMNDGVIHRRGAGSDVSVVRYQSYAFDLSAFGPASTPTLLPKDRTLAYLANPDPDDRYYQSRPQSFRAEYHRRFSEWMYPMVVALIALAVAGDARSFREARIHPLITTMTIALAVRWAGYFASDRNETHPAMAYAVYAVPILSMMASAWFIAVGRTMELPTSAAERIASLRRSLAERMLGFRPFGRKEARP